jgi:hypothetical protein
VDYQPQTVDGTTVFFTGALYRPRRKGMKDRHFLGVQDGVVRYRVAGSSYERECTGAKWLSWMGYEVGPTVPIHPVIKMQA